MTGVRPSSHWVMSLPDEIIAVRPVLGVALAGALAQVSEFDTVGRPARRRRAFAARRPRRPWPVEPPDGLVVVDREGYRLVPAMIETYRAALDLSRGDLAGTVGHARQALALAGPDDHLVRAAAGALGGLAAWTEGDLERRHAAYTASVNGLRRAGYVADVLGCSITLADIRLTQGRVEAAVQTYQRALELTAPPPGTAPLRGTADMHVGIAGALLDRGDRGRGAASTWRSASGLGEANGLPQHPYRWRLVKARLLAPRATWTVRSGSSTRPTGSTSATTPPT